MKHDIHMKITERTKLLNKANVIHEQSQVISYFHLFMDPHDFANVIFYITLYTFTIRRKIECFSVRGTWAESECCAWKDYSQCILRSLVKKTIYSNQTPLKMNQQMLDFINLQNRIKFSISASLLACTTYRKALYCNRVSSTNV